MSKSSNLKIKKAKQDLVMYQESQGGGSLVRKSAVDAMNKLCVNASQILIQLERSKGFWMIGGPISQQLRQQNVALLRIVTKIFLII